MGASTAPLNPFETFLHLKKDGDVEVVPVTDDLWARLYQEPLDGRLSGAFRMQADTGWEVHPDGEEILYLATGAIDLILERGDGERIELRAGQCCTVPRGVWHRQEVVEPAELFFSTPGPRTEHRPLAG
ncbi:MAG TPA: cupin domain-containing protein [Acidimicrobiales bacterium]|nr:cupin domain-containing protein [Acidimicrobiales bacterium]